MDFKKISHIKELDGMVNAVGMFIKYEKTLTCNYTLHVYDKKGRKIPIEGIGEDFDFLQDWGFDFIKENPMETNAPLTDYLKKNSILCLPEERKTTMEDLNVFFKNHGLGKEWFDLSQYKKGRIIQSVTNKKGYKYNSKTYYGLKLK